MNCKKKSFFLADEILSDEKKRALYDQVGEQGMMEHMDADGVCNPAPPDIMNKLVGDCKVS